MNSRRLLRTATKAYKSSSLLASTPLSLRPTSSLFPSPSQLSPAFSRLASSSSQSPPQPSPPPPPPSPSLGELYEEAQRARHARRNRSLLLYSTATVILVGAASYLAVPLYRVFCSATGYGGTPSTDKSRFGADRLQPDQTSDRRIRVQFNADASDALPWSFTPQQKEVRVLPGETALAFYTATNNSDEDIIGIATYNVTPNNVSSRVQGRKNEGADAEYVMTRSRPISPKSSASASKSSASSLARRSTSPSSSSSTATS